MSSILFEFKEYMKSTYGINPRYKGFNYETSSTGGDYGEQNTVLILPDKINYTTNDYKGIQAVELRGELCLFVTEERLKENFLFEKLLLQKNKDSRFNIVSEFGVEHFNEELLCISVQFVYMNHFEFDKKEEVPLSFQNEIIINKI